MNERYPEFDSFEEARHYQVFYACSTCWGNLIIHQIDNGRRYRLFCPKTENKECSGSGIVSLRSIQRIRAENFNDYLDECQIHPELDGNRQDENELMNKLGF